MAPPHPPLWPLETEVFGERQDKSIADDLSATYRYYEAPRKRVVGNPADDIAALLQRELSLGDLADMLKHLWFTGAERPATTLHFHVAMGREMAFADRMDLHLLWANKRRLFVKPVPRFLLDPAFCRSNLQCPDGCACYNPPADTCRGIARKVALGFLYTYACLISSESDFHMANETRLLPRNEDDAPIKWADWKALVGNSLECTSVTQMWPTHAFCAPGSASPASIPSIASPVSLPSTPTSTAGTTIAASSTINLLGWPLPLFSWPWC